MKLCILICFAEYFLNATLKLIRKFQPHMRQISHGHIFPTTPQSCFRGARRIHDSARTRTRQEHTIIKASNQLWEVSFWGNKVNDHGRSVISHHYK